MNDVSASAGTADFSLADTNDFENGLNDDLRARVKHEIEPGERLLWAGRCEPLVESRGVGFYVACMITVCLLGLGLCLIMPPRAVQRWWNDGSAIVVGLAFLGVALVFIIVLTANWTARRAQRRRMTNTHYAITDRRAIIWAPVPSTDSIRVETLVRGQVRNLVRVERPDGVGTLELAGTAWDAELGYYEHFRFVHVSQVRRVEQIVRHNLMTSGISVT